MGSTVIGLLASVLLLTMLIGEAVAEVVTEGWEAINADVVAGILIGVGLPPILVPRTMRESLPFPLLV